MADTLNGKYLVLDLETTGLDPTKDRILEVAAIIVDGDYQELARYESVVHCPEQLLYRRMSEYVRKMHGENNLLMQVPNGRALAEVEAELMEFTGLRALMLSGNSVHFDRGFLRHWMPDFEGTLHHRHVDASTLAQLFPELRTGSKVAHRALSDALMSAATIRDCIADLG